MDINKSLEKIQEYLLNACKKLTLETIKQECNYDRTKFGIITELGSNYGIVKMNGETYKCKLKDGIDLAVNDSVIVIVPNGNFNMKYIDGKLKK